MGYTGTEERESNASGLETYRVCVSNEPKVTSHDLKLDGTIIGEVIHKLQTAMAAS